MMTTAVLVNYLSFVFSSINGNFYMYYSCAIQKNVLPLQRETLRREVCASAEGFADILKRRLLALCSDL